jgi:hypothetical protein
VVFHTGDQASKFPEGARGMCRGDFSLCCMHHSPSRAGSRCRGAGARCGPQSFGDPARHGSLGVEVHNTRARTGQTQGRSISEPFACVRLSGSDDVCSTTSMAFVAHPASCQVLSTRTTAKGVQVVVAVRLLLGDEQGRRVRVAEGQRSCLAGRASARKASKGSAEKQQCVQEGWVQCT